MFKTRRCIATCTCVAHKNELSCNARTSTCTIGLSFLCLGADDVVRIVNTDNPPELPRLFNVSNRTQHFSVSAWDVDPVHSVTSVPAAVNLVRQGRQIRLTPTPEPRAGMTLRQIFTGTASSHCPWISPLGSIGPYENSPRFRT